MATTTIGVAIALDGEKQFKQAVSSINSDLKVLASEMEKATSQFSKNSSSMEALKSKSEQYTKQIETQKEKIEILRSALENSQNNYTKAGENVEKWKQKLSDAEQELERLKNSENATTEEIQAQEKVVAELSGKLETAEKNYTTAEKRTESWQISLNKAETQLNKMEAELSDTNSKLKEMGDNAKYSAAEVEAAKDKIKDFGDKAQEIGESAKKVFKAIGVAVAAVGTAIGAVAIKSVSIGSEFEAQMKKVQAISGASSDELAELTETAREMGAATKFTATEAGEALEYMAMAGWETDEMLSGLSGVMNLAAASGSGLATASDLLTDSLTAFGLTAADSADLADKMAYAATSSNTTMEQLGAAYKECAATSTQLGYGLNETTAALMVMADGGIKGGAAGTALASIMTRLGNNTSKCRDMLEKYGVTVYDSEGNVQSLSSILTGLQGVWAGLTDEQKSNLAYVVAGKTAQAEFMTVMGDSTGAFSAYASGLADCAGAAKNMADTMQDNLSGQVTILQSGLQELALGFYDGLQKPLTDTVKTAISAVNNPTIKAGVKAVSAQIGELAEEFASFAAKNLPAVIKGFQKVATYLSSSSFKTTLKTVGSILTSTGKVALTFGKITLPIVAKGIEALAKSGKVLIPVLTSAYVGFKALKTITETIELVKKAKEAFSALNVVMAANPYALAAAAIAAVGVALVGMAATCGETEDKYADLKAEIDANTESMKEMAEARQESYEAAYAEIYEVERLKDRLRELVDENGNLKGSKEELKGVIEKLNEYGFEVELSKTGDLIESYDELNKSIDDYIQKKELQARLDSLEPEYNEYIVNKYQYHSATNEAKKAYEDAASDFEQKWGFKFGSQEYIDYANSNRIDTVKMAEDAQAIGELIEEYNEAFKKEETAIELINAVNEAYTLQESGKYDEAIERLNLYFEKRNETFKRAENYEKSQRNQAISDLGEQLKEEIGLYEVALNTGGQDMIDSCLEYVQQAADELSEAGVEIPEGLVEGLKSGEISVEEAMQTISELIEDGVSGVDLSDSGEDATNSYAEGISSGEPAVKTAADSAAVAAMKEFNSEKRAAEAKSGGKLMGSNLGDGISETEPAVTESAKTVITAATNELSSQSAKDLAKAGGKSVGTSFGNGISTGISSKMQAIKNVAANAINAAITAAKKAGNINSPSKKTRDLIGKPLAEGIGVGIELQSSEVAKKAAAATRNIVTQMQIEADDIEAMQRSYNNALYKLNSPRQISVGDLPSDMLKLIVSGLRPNYTVNNNNTFNSATAREGSALLRQLDRDLGAKV